MISHPGSPSTALSIKLPIDSLDIVASQGAYLIPRAGTPVSQKAYDDHFVSALEHRLDTVSTLQIIRRLMYHDEADEWPMGRTPPEVKEKRNAELEALVELEGATSNDGSDDDRHKGGGTDSGCTMPAPDRPRRPRHASLLPKPPLSVESPLAKPHRRKRRRLYKENAGGKERYVQEHVSSTNEVLTTAGGTVLNTSQHKNWTRRQAFDVADEEEVDEQPVNKFRITTARSSSICSRRLRPRPRRPAG